MKEQKIRKYSLFVNISDFKVDSNKMILNIFEGIKVCYLYHTVVCNIKYFKKPRCQRMILFVFSFDINNRNSIDKKSIFLSFSLFREKKRDTL